MKVRDLHAWDLSPGEACRVQESLRTEVSLKNSFRNLSEIRLIAGADIACDADSGRLFAAAIVYTFPELKEIERKGAEELLTFPYVPGLLSFREAPALISVFSKLENEPDLVIFDGQGIAHPRGLGIASHLGLFLDKPTIGCAKSFLYGEYKAPAAKKGSASPLLSKKGKRIGSVVRAIDRGRPLFVSPGHKVSVATSLRVILKCMDGYRVPKPTREADRLAAKVKEAALAGKYSEAVRNWC